MVYYPGFRSKLERYYFFKNVYNNLIAFYDSPVNQLVNRTGKTDAWMRLRYPRVLKYGMYELHFSDVSPTHKEFFGLYDDLSVLAFYYGGDDLYTPKKKRNLFLSKLQEFLPTISEDFGEDVQAGHWGEEAVEQDRKWVILGTLLNNLNLGTDANLYHPVFSRFIISTFDPIQAAYQVIS